MFPKSPKFFNKNIEFCHVPQRKVRTANHPPPHPQQYNWRFLWVESICEAFLSQTDISGCKSELRSGDKNLSQNGINQYIRLAVGNVWSIDDFCFTGYLKWKLKDRSSLVPQVGTE